MPQLNLISIDARVLSRLDGNSLLYPASQRTSDINEAIKVVNLITAFATVSVEVLGFTIKNQLVYPTPPGILIPGYVYFNGKQLERLSLRAASMRYRSWATDVANLGQPVQEWIPMGLGMFAIHPADDRGGQTITVNGIAELAPLVGPLDSITIPDECAEMVEELAAHTLQIKESGMTFSQASLLYQKFIRTAKQFSHWQTVSFPRYFVRMQAAEQAQEMGDDAR